MRYVTTMLIVILLLGCVSTVALAKDGGAGKGKAKAGQQGQRPPVVFGEITALSKNSLTLKPELPEKMRERMKERGREMPKLPKELKIKLGPDTKWYFDGGEGNRKDFAVGDQVVVKLLRGKQEQSPTAEIVADPETAKQYIMEKMRERGQGERGKGEGRQQRGKHGQDGGTEGWAPGGEEGGPFGPGMEGPGGPGFGPGGDEGGPFGPGMEGPGGPGFGPGGDEGGPGFGPGGEGDGPGFGPGGMGGPGGEDGPGRRGPRPAIGVITKISGDSITIKPELPEFLADKLKERDIDMPKLPETLSCAITDGTVFVLDGEKQSKNPFSKGDKVVLMLGRPAGDQPSVRVIVDFATAKQKMEEMMQNREERRGDRQGGQQRERKRDRQDW